MYSYLIFFVTIQCMSFPHVFSGNPLFVYDMDARLIRQLAIGVNLRKELLNCHEIYLVDYDFINYYLGFNPTLLKYSGLKPLKLWHKL